ncbi:hypothetical protein C0991_000015 [Blastosporella zonata]|nr:hypothetical protein C0991_000015 [Blastosporella zonata]
MKPELRMDKCLVAALIPWSLTHKQLTRHHCNSPNKYLPPQANMEPFLKDENQWLRTIRMKSRYHHALRLLDFPEPLRKYLSDDGHVRTFTLWGDGGNHNGIESIFLSKILEKCRTRRVHLDDTFRLIFIHVGAIKSLHKLPRLSELSSASIVQFYTYGSHETVAPQDWGIHDPIGVVHRISQIHSHPMWECYILPSVLGMVVKIYSQREKSDAVADFDSGRFPYTKLLGMIEDGEISLISSPSKLSPTKDHDPCQDWMKKYWTYRPQGPRAILQTCIDTFDGKYGEIRPEDWTPTILYEVSKDIRCMRSLPLFMKEYRRYIVLDSPKAQHNARHDALEWVSTRKLDFKDEFFPSQ